MNQNYFRVLTLISISSFIFFSSEEDAVETVTEVPTPVIT